MRAGRAAAGGRRRRSGRWRRGRNRRRGRTGTHGDRDGRRRSRNIGPGGAGLGHARGAVRGAVACGNDDSERGEAEEVVVLFVARLRWEKGLAAFADALRTLAQFGRTHRHPLSTSRD